jgi:hypothetical protein
LIHRPYDRQLVDTVQDVLVPQPNVCQQTTSSELLEFDSRFALELSFLAILQSPPSSPFASPRGHHSAVLLRQLQTTTVPNASASGLRLYLVSPRVLDLCRSHLSSSCASLCNGGQGTRPNRARRKWLSVRYIGITTGVSGGDIPRPSEW